MVIVNGCVHRRRGGIKQEVSEKCNNSSSKTLCSGRQNQRARVDQQNKNSRDAPAAGRMGQVDLRGLGLDGNVVRQADVTRRDVVVGPGAREQRAINTAPNEKHEATNTNEGLGMPTYHLPKSFTSESMTGSKNQTGAQG